MKEVVKLERMGEQHPGAASVRSYVELLADLPWSKRAAELLREDGTHVHQPPSSLESVKRALDAGHEVRTGSLWLSKLWEGFWIGFMV